VSSELTLKMFPRLPLAVLLRPGLLASAQRPTRLERATLGMMTTLDASGGSRLPRDAAGYLDLTEGTGGIIAMCSCDDFIEVYKQDVTFRVQTPESIDPDRTNPRAPFVAAVADSVGCSNPIVARVLLQGQDIIKAAAFEPQIDDKAVIRELHAIKEALVACYKVADRVGSHVDRIVKEGETHGLPGDKRGSFNPFPQVPDLDADTTNFLIQAKRAIRRISSLPAIFFSIPGDSDFDHLLKRLSNVPAAKDMLNFVRDNTPGIGYLSELRNCQEHPKKGRETRIDNFKVLPDGTVAVPMWYVTGETPRPIAGEMRQAIEFLTMMAEAMLIHLVMAGVTRKFPFIIQPIEPVDPTNPMKYRLSLNLTVLKLDSPSLPEPPS
jgi:hypothetical protein